MLSRCVESQSGIVSIKSPKENREHFVRRLGLLSMPNEMGEGFKESISNLFKRGSNILKTDGCDWDSAPRREPH
jgi:hypothetical protein